MTHHDRLSGAIPKLLFVLILVGLMSTSAVGTALAQSVPYLKVENATLNMHGQSTFTVPVLLNPDGASLSSIIFSLSFDEGCLTFDKDTRRNNNSVLPDAITSYVPDGFITFPLDIASNEVTLIILSPPSPSMPVITGTVEAPLFDIEFGVLPACANTVGTEEVTPFAFPTATFGTSSGEGNGGTAFPGTYTLRFNATPTEITLDPADIDENQPFDTVVGDLVTDDPDFHLSTPPARPAEGHTYSLVDDGCSSGPYTNSPFWIDGTELKTIGSLDFETAPSYDICVRSTDNYGLSKDQDFTINVNDLGEIEGILLDNDSPAGEYHILEGTAPPHWIGQLTTLDDNQGRTYNYALEDLGCGGDYPDNESFMLATDDPPTSVVKDRLWATAIFNYAEQSIYNICVRTIDIAQPANYLDRTFTILVDDDNGAPVAVDDFSLAQPLIAQNCEGCSTLIPVLDNDTDPDGDVLEVHDTDAVGGMWAVLPKSHIVYLGTPINSYSYRGAYEFTYTVKDLPGAQVSQPATVTMYVIGDDERGDCNHDGTVDAGDLTATVHEIYDDDVDPIEPKQWWHTHLGGFEGSAIGCDSNGLRNGPDPANPLYSVGAADLTCTVRLFFNESCGGGAVSAAAADSTATLYVADGLQVAAGQTVAVPVVLDTAGQNISAMAFTLNFDATVLNLDPADADSDGIADAVKLKIPAGMAKMVSVDAQAGRIQVAIFGTSLPLQMLQDGVIASIALQARSEVAGGASALDLARVSLGDDLGDSVPVMADGNDVVIGAGGSGNSATGSDNQLYLPQLRSSNN